MASWTLPVRSVAYMPETSVRLANQMFSMKDPGDEPLSAISKWPHIFGAARISSNSFSNPGEYAAKSGCQPNLNANAAVPEQKLLVDAMTLPATESSVITALPFAAKASTVSQKKAASERELIKDVPTCLFQPRCSSSKKRSIHWGRFRFQSSRSKKRDLVPQVGANAGARLWPACAETG